MKRLWVTALFVVVMTAVVEALAVALHTRAWPVAPGLLVLAHAILMLPAVDTLVIAALVGLLTDALGGNALGVNMLAAVLTALATRASLKFWPGTEGWWAVAFVAVVSALHVITVVTVEGLLFSVGWQGFMRVLPLVIGNASAALLLLPLWQWLQVRAGLLADGPSAVERLERRRAGVV
jgi:rod shape-determining protein MreD